MAGGLRNTAQRREVLKLWLVEGSQKPVKLLNAAELTSYFHDFREPNRWNQLAKHRIFTHRRLPLYEHPEFCIFGTFYHKIRNFYDKI